jgi:hypothetical protein
MALASRHMTIALLSAALLMLALGTASAESVTSERLSLRPQKEPATCVGSGVCPLVSAPRVGHRRSTIPGISNPDHGRPPVIVIKPFAKPATPGFRTFGGNTGIFGNP